MTAPEVQPATDALWCVEVPVPGGPPARVPAADRGHAEWMAPHLAGVAVEWPGDPGLHAAMLREFPRLFGVPTRPEVAA